MAISSETINQVKDRIDIVEVVTDFVALKKRGHNMIACCPFHNEKTPSFNVSPSKQIFKCFGCGKAGDAITFVEEIEGIGYLEAIRYLARKYGIEIAEEEGVDEEALSKQRERDGLYIVLDYAARYFQEQLFETEEGKSIGLSYFKERGFSEKTIRSFGLGYAGDAWDGLLKSAKEKAYSADLLEKAGLIIRKEEKTYDRFRGRVIFPIHSTSGKVLGFGARILKSEKNQPKYINSPESEVYHKSKVLYGLHQAKTAIRQKDNCYLVEGYTDVISLHQSGVENVVASSGTSLTEEQIRLISRYTKHITVLFDGDAAGIKASLRGIDMILEQDMNVKVVLFPDGDDPDSYSRKVGSTAFQEYLNENATDFITFKTRLFVDEGGKDPIKKAGVIREIVESIAKIPDPIKRSVLVKESSRLLDMEESILITELNYLHQKKRREVRQPNQGSNYESQEEQIQEAETEKVLSKEDAMRLQERESVRLLISYGTNELDDNEGNLCHFILAGLSDIEFQTPIYQEILEFYKLELENGHIPDVNFFLKNSRADIRDAIIDLVTSRYEVSLNWKKHEILVPKEEDILDKVVLNNLLQLKYRTLQKAVYLILDELKKTEDQADMEILMARLKGLKIQEMEVAKMLGIVVSR